MLFTSIFLTEKDSTEEWTNTIELEGLEISETNKKSETEN